MKRILSIITIIIILLVCHFTYDKKEVLYKEANPISHHIEPNKKVEIKKIEKEPISQDVPQKARSQVPKKSKQTIEVQKESRNNTSLPIKKEVTTYSQYLSAQQINQIKTELLSLINKERAKAVTLYDPLKASANLRAFEANQKWSHIRPNGAKWNTALSSIINIKSVPHGENLGQIRINSNNIDIPSIISSLHQGLVNSSTHYKVMTNENYKKVNIGVYSNLNNNILTITIAQHFIR